MQVNRLFEIIYVLLDKKQVTARELAERFEISVRTVYRDIDVLSQAGIPIYMSKGKGGGISLLDNYVLNKSILSDSEQKEILAALQSLNAVSYPEADSILSKLGLLFNKEDCSWVDVDFSHWGEGNREKFNVIKAAILNKRVIRFSYSSSYGQNSKREVEPLQLCFKDKTWYLKAYCLTRRSYRIFRLTRMQAVKPTEDVFEKKQFDSSVFKADRDINYPSVTFRLQLDKSVAYRVYDEFDESSIVENADGSFDVYASYPESDWLYGYILSYGRAAKVMEPEYLRDIIVNELARTLGQYGKDIKCK